MNLNRTEAYAAAEALLVHAQQLRLAAKRRDASGPANAPWRQVQRNNARYNEQLAMRIRRAHGLGS